MEVEIKSLLAEVKALQDDPNGEFEAILSTKAVDRDGESVAPGALNPLPARIPLYHQHDWLEKALPVGSAEPYYDGDVLKIKGAFASTPRAQEVRTLVNEGHLSSMSVGYLRGQKAFVNGQKTVTKAVLLEGSFTAVPINTEAAVLASKSLEESVAKAMGHAHVHSHGRVKALSEAPSSGGALVQPDVLRHFHSHSHPDGSYDHTDDSHPHEHPHGGMKAVGDADDDPGVLAQGVDAALDEIAASLDEENPDQTKALVTAAQAVVDSLLVALGVSDADDPDVKAMFSDKERQKLADSGAAMPDGGFPIRNVSDLKNAIQAVGRAKNRAAAITHIKKRAAALGATDQLPDDWKSLTEDPAASEEDPAASDEDPAASDDEEQVRLRAKALHLSAQAAL